MVAYLARCQLDPAMPRSSIETLLHAFVPAAHVHHTHPDGINMIAGAADGEELVRECFGDEAAWIPYIRPGFTLVQAGRRGGARRRPGCRLVVLAKHGLVTLGRQAEEAYRATIDAINRPSTFVNERTNGARALRRRRPAARLDDRRRDELLAAAARAARGGLAASAEAAASSTRRRRCSSSSPPRGARRS